jgi:hypothetical protein
VDKEKGEYLQEKRKDWRRIWYMKSHVREIIDGCWFSFLLSVSWGGVRLSPLGTLATIWPIVSALDDR